MDVVYKVGVNNPYPYNWYHINSVFGLSQFGMVIPVVYLRQYVILTGICKGLSPTLRDQWESVFK